MEEESDSVNIPVSLERLQRIARGRVPEPDGTVVGCGRDQLAVRREGHGVDIIRMALERLQRSPRGRVPEPDGTVVGCGRYQLAVRREGHGVDPRRMAL